MAGFSKDDWRDDASPTVGLAFVWNTIRDQDMVCIGTTTVGEAREVLDPSLDVFEKRIPENQLQRTRSKDSSDV